MPVLELQLAVFNDDGSLDFAHDQLITPKGMNADQAIDHYEAANPLAQVLTTRWMVVDELTPRLPQFAVAAPPAKPPTRPRPAPTWPSQLLNAWPLLLAFAGILAINAVATAEHVRAGIERQQMEARR